MRENLYYLFRMHNLDVDKLLGEPIQKDLETDSGIKATMESILGICAGMENVFQFGVGWSFDTLLLLCPNGFTCALFTSDHLIKMFKHELVRSAYIGRLSDCYR